METILQKRGKTILDGAGDRSAGFLL